MQADEKRRLAMLLRSVSAAAAIALATVAHPLMAKPAITDCLAARAAYSSNTLLIDLLLDPRTKAVLEAHGSLKGFPALLTDPTPPTFSAIVTLRWLLTTGAFGAPVTGPKALAALDRTLAAIPITGKAAERRCARYDHQPPVLPEPGRRPAILVFEKITGFRDDASVAAAHKAFIDMAARRGWSITFTENGAVFSRAQLTNYDAVVWNNVSGDALTVPQERAFQAYLMRGGGFAGVHGSGGDPVYIWKWYTDVLLAAKFIGHPMRPQFQAANVMVEGPKTGIVARLPNSWTMTEEWYSFSASPRIKGLHVLARLDESSYSPGPQLAMGDHPIAWNHCVGSGRAFYTAIGHRPESYLEPNSRELLEAGVAWAAGLGDTRCKAGREVGAPISARP
jgi:hypothetical protein